MSMKVMDKPALNQRTLDAVRAYFEPQLEIIGLSVEQIEHQTLDELEVSLSNVNSAIEHPELFGSMSLSFAVKGGELTSIISSPSEAQMSVGALPLLLERKSMILRRIGILRPQAQLNDLEKIVAETVEDEGERESLLKSIGISKEEATAQAHSLQLQTEQTEQERERVMRLQVEVKERTSAMRRAWFERESVASIVGALLLISLGAAVIISMFTHTAASQIVTSSFLLILGYFFGQAGSNKQRRRKLKKSKSEPSIQVK